MQKKADWARESRLIAAIFAAVTTWPGWYQCFVYTEHSTYGDSVMAAALMPTFIFPFSILLATSLAIDAVTRHSDKSAEDKRQQRLKLWVVSPFVIGICGFLLLLCGVIGFFVGLIFLSPFIWAYCGRRMMAWQFCHFFQLDTPLHDSLVTALSKGSILAGWLILLPLYIGTVGTALMTRISDAAALFPALGLFLAATLSTAVYLYIGYMATQSLFRFNHDNKIGNLLT